MKKVTYFILCLVLIFGGFAEVKFLDLFYADVYVKKGRELLNNGEYYDALMYFDKAVEKNPKESFYYRNRAQGYMSLASSEDISYVDSLKTLALKDLEFAYSLNSKNLRFLRNSIPIYYLIAKDDQPNSRFFNVTKDYFSSLKQEYPNDLGVLVDIATYEKKLGWIGGLL